LWYEPQSEEVREDLVHQSIDGSLSIRIGQYKLEMCPGSGGWSDPKPGQEPEDAPRFQLYDLSEDIGEKKNIIEDHPELAKRMRKILKDHVRNGRSTPGAPQKNTDDHVWETVKWLLEED
ncbi:MAG: arylsulfatase, partial [Lachnospiraceae bacterium]|nr:arylsulfatase [Lachnospiraceae bacterium]